MQPNQKFTDQQFLELYNKDLNDPQIAKTLNVSTETVKKRRTRLELMPKKPKPNSNPTLSHQKLKESDKRQNQKPERKESKRAYFKNYNKRPEVKAKNRIRARNNRQQPENKAKKKIYNKNYRKKQHQTQNIIKTTNQAKT
jgi:hypothetical protein